MAEQDFDLIVVGAGLVGQALAADVARQLPQWRIALVAPQAAPPTGQAFDPRVVALTEASRRQLAALGVWERLARPCPYGRMDVWDGEGNGRIVFDSAELGADSLGHIVENRDLTVALDQVLADAPVTRIEAPVSELVYRDNAVAGVVLEDGRPLRAPLVAAADGARSRLRDWAGLATREWSYGQRAIVTTVRTAEPHASTAYQRFMRTGPLAFLPLCEGEGDAGHHCSIVWSADEPLADELMALPDEAFCQRLTRAFEDRLGDITHSARRFDVPLVQRHAKRYVTPGLALVGDAAHSIHPLAGQGVNLGFADVAALVKELERAGRRGLGAGEYATLKRYERARVGHNLTMMAAMESFKRLFGQRALTLMWLRNRALSGVDGLPALKRVLAREAMGL